MMRDELYRGMRPGKGLPNCIQQPNVKPFSDETRTDVLKRLDFFKDLC